MRAADPMPSQRGTGSRPIRTLVAGLGWVALNRHIPQILRNTGFSLAGVIDRRPGRAQEVASKFAGARWAEAASIADVPWLDDIDAVVVTSAPTTHAELTIGALLQGKHVLVEKPFAMTPDEGRRMTDAARSSGRVLAVVHNFQFSHSVGKLRKDLATGALGSIKSVFGVQLGNPSRRLPEWFEELPLGLFYDESPHLLYLLDSLAAAPLSVSRAACVPSTLGMRTPAQISATLFEAGGNRPFSIHCNFEAPVSEWYLVVCGTSGLGVADIFRDIYIRLPNDGRHTAWPVLRTSLLATWQHWRQVLARGIGHITGRLVYGNDEVYDLFGQAVHSGKTVATPVHYDKAQTVLELQHAIVAATRTGPTSGPR